MQGEKVLLEAVAGRIARLAPRPAVEPEFCRAADGDMAKHTGAHFVLLLLGIFVC